MSLEYIIKFIFIFSSCGLISIGYFFDERLDFYGINLSTVISVFYSISAFLLLLQIKPIKFTRPKFILYLFYLLVLISTPILWSHFGLNEYGIRKFITFSLLIVPISVIIIEVFTKKDTVFMMWVLFFVASLLLLLGIINIENVSSLKGGRMSVMGGGPIVFSRWLVIGSLILFLHPNVNKIYKYLFVPLFILFSLMAGSRGPIYSYAIIMIIYFVFTFRKNILKVLVLSLLALSVVFLIPVENNKNEYGNTSRVVMGTSIGGYARIDRIERSIKLIAVSPFGVGTGNWAMESNKFSLLSHRDKEYAHNIILELANESGILISIVFLILVVLLFMSAFEVIREKERYLSRIFFVLFFFMLLNALVSGDLMDDRFLFIFLSLYLSSVTLENNLEKQLTK